MNACFETAANAKGRKQGCGELEWGGEERRRLKKQREKRERVERPAKHKSKTSKEHFNQKHASSCCCSSSFPVAPCCSIALHALLSSVRTVDTERVAKRKRELSPFEFGRPGVVNLEGKKNSNVCPLARSGARRGPHRELFDVRQPERIPFAGSGTCFFVRRKKRKRRNETFRFPSAERWEPRRRSSKSPLRACASRPLSLLRSLACLSSWRHTRRALS